MFKRFVSVITNFLTDYFDYKETCSDEGVDDLKVVKIYGVPHLAHRFMFQREVCPKI